MSRTRDGGILIIFQLMEYDFMRLYAIVIKRGGGDSLFLLLFITSITFLMHVGDINCCTPQVHSETSGLSTDAHKTFLEICKACAMITKRTTVSFQSNCRVDCEALIHHHRLCNIDPTRHVDVKIIDKNHQLSLVTLLSALLPSFHT